MMDTGYVNVPGILWRIPWRVRPQAGWRLCPRGAPRWSARRPTCARTPRPPRPASPSARSRSPPWRRGPRCSSLWRQIMRAEPFLTNVAGTRGQWQMEIVAEKYLKLLSKLLNYWFVPPDMCPRLALRMGICRYNEWWRNNVIPKRLPANMLE